MNTWLKNFYRRLPIARELNQIRDQMGLASLARLNTYREILLSKPKYQDPRKLNSFEVQTFSQNLEDGILAEIFRRIGIGSKIFVELGVGDGMENNTAFLLFQGWRGFWVEGDEKANEQILRNFSDQIAASRLVVNQGFITAENITDTLETMRVPKKFDLLSVDIDRNTYHVWAALRALQPRVVVVEYNASFPPSVDWVIDYESRRTWNGTMYFGASLKAFEQLGRSLGYELVGCDTSGTNAFFIHRDEKLDLFASPFTAENHYEPPRYWMAHRVGHTRCFNESMTFK
jgi:hypothetical protein